MSTEWVEEVELSSEEIQIRTPSSTIRCSIGRTSVEVLYNPMVRANLISVSFAHTYLTMTPSLQQSKPVELHHISD